MRSRLTTTRIVGSLRSALRRIGRGGTGPREPGSGRRPGTDGGSGGQRPAAVDVGLSGVQFEYAPSADGDPDPGEVVWTWVPYEDDPLRGKDRPVVVVGRRGRALVGVALTSQRNERSPQVEVGSGAWDSQGRPSYAKLDRVLELDPEQIRREGATLRRDRFDAVVAALARAHGPGPRRPPATGR